jgi:hypothetical protein
MYEWWESTQDVSQMGRCGSLQNWIQLLTKVVVPSNMNPIGEEGNVFSALFDKVPAKRAGIDDDIAGTVLYLVSRAGVSLGGIVGAEDSATYGSQTMLIMCLELCRWDIALC